MCPHDDRRGLLALLGLSVLIGSLGVFTRALGHSQGLLAQVGLRIFCAALIINVLLCRRIDYRKYFRLPAREWLLLAARAAGMYVLHMTFLSLAFLQAKFIKVAGVYVFPWAAVLGGLLTRDGSRRKALWVGLAAVGVAVLSADELADPQRWNLGHLLALLAGFCHGGVLLTRKFHQDHLSDEEITNAMIVLGGGMVLVSAAVFDRPPDLEQIDAGGAVVLAAAGLVNVLCLFLANYGMKRIDPYQASSLLCLVVPFTHMAGWLLFGEMLSFTEAVGALLIILCSTQIVRPEPRLPKP